MQIINYHNMNILAREKGPQQVPEPHHQQQPLPPECVDTRLVIWDNDEFEDFQVDFLNQVYPEKINKDTMVPGAQFVFHFLSKSLNFWVQLKENAINQNLSNTNTPNSEQQKPRLGKKDIKFIESVLTEQGCENATNYNRWGKHFNKKEQFHKRESEQEKFRIPKGEEIKTYFRNQDQDEYVIIRYFGDNQEFIPYKQKFQILFLFYIDGVSFVHEETEEWEYFVIFEKKKMENLQEHFCFVGVLSKYIFKLTAVRERHRISQVFILPSFQNQGHGKQLLDLVYQRCLDLPSCFQITTQIPSFEYQCLRDYKQLQLILSRKLVNFSNVPKIGSKQDIEIAQQDYILTKQVLRKLKESVKLPGNQIERLIHLLIYAKIQSQADNEMAMAYFEQFVKQRVIFNKSAFKSRKKVPHITFEGTSADMKQFFLEKAKQDYLRNQQQIQEVVKQTIDGFSRVIKRLIKSKLIEFL